MGVGGRTNPLASRLNSILGAAPTDLASLLGIRSPFERQRRVTDRQCLSRWDSNSQSRKVSDRQSNPEPDSSHWVTKLSTDSGWYLFGAGLDGSWSTESSRNDVAYVLVDNHAFEN
jgi:hypothetical protein